MRRLATIACALLVLAATDAAANPGNVTVDATADPNVVELGESVTFKLEVRVEGDDSISVSGEPKLGRTFRVVGRTVSPRKVWRKGQTILARIVSFRLLALQTGSHTLQPPEVTVGGTPIEIEAPTVRVVEDNAGSSNGRAPHDSSDSRRRGRAGRDDRPGEPFQLRTHLEPGAEPYIGQQVTLIYRLLADPHQGSVKSRAPETPEFDAFWLENLTRTLRGRSKMTNVDGRYMRSSVLAAYALFPLETGEIELDSTSVRIRTGGLVRDGRKRTVRSDGITFDIRPLPDGAPTSFYEGNVGSWSFRVDADNRTGRRGGAVTLRLIADGSGNVGRVRLPNLEGIAGFEVANRTEDVETEMAGTTIRGRKVVDYALTPKRTGTVTVPALEFSYFNPTAESYRTETSDPVEFEIREAKTKSDGESNSSTGGSGSPGGDEVDRRERLRTSLAGPIRKGSPSGTGSEGATETFIYMIAAGLPLGGLLVLWLAPTVGRVMRGFRARHGDHETLEHVRERFHRAADEHEDAPAILHDAWGEYCTDVLDIPAGRVEPEEVETPLERRGVDSSLAGEVAALLDWCETARFSPSAQVEEDDSARMAERSERLLDRLEEQRAGGADAAGGSTASAATAGLAALLAITCSSPRTAAAADGNETAEEPSFERAVELQESGDWKRAAEIWNHLIRREDPSPSVRYNLGTALVHLGELGGARVQLERAAYSAPANDKIEKNLEIVRELVRIERLERSDTDDAAGDLERDLEWWKTAAGLNPRPFWGAGVAALWLIVLGAYARRRWSEGRYRWVATCTVAAGVAITAACAAGTAAKSTIARGTDPVVVTSDAKLETRQGPSEHAPAALPTTPVVPGTMLRVRAERDDWIRVGLPTESGDDTIWLPAEAVEALRGVSA